MKLIWRVAALLATVCVLHAEVQTCRTLQRHGKLKEASACDERLTRSSDAFERAEGWFALGRFQDANDDFRQADKARPNSALVKSEWARLFASYSQPADAAKLYEEAIEADQKYAPAYLGLARMLSENYDKRAVEFADKALEIDPKLAEAHEFLGYLALEDGDEKQAADEAHQAIALDAEALDGLAVLASIDWLKGSATSASMDRILQIDPAYGEAYVTGAHFFVINYRYEEAVAYYRKALSLNPGLVAARSQLGVNLMRLGRTDEARQQLEQCFAAHFRDAETVNSLRLLDTLGDYEVRKTASAEILIHKKEAALLYPYIQPELERAIAVYQRKYNVTLPRPVRLEVYPNHDDFAVRTLGLPGQGGLLGVTFGTVVAMDSPSARPPGQENWADTMWHELNHVYVITGSNKLVPRWFAEGLAVHEEAAASPGWGNRLTPDIIAALKDKKLLPVLQLDRGFVRPEYSNQVLVSYFEAGKICDYIAGKWGNGAILGIIHSYAEHQTTAEAIQNNLHESPEAFDKGFASWLDGQTLKIVQHFEDWRKAMNSAHADLDKKQFEDAAKEATAARDLYPEYVGAGNAYGVLAESYLAANNDATNKRKAVHELEAYRDRGGDDVESLKKLAQLEQDLSERAQAANTLEKLTFIYPEDEQVHRQLGSLLLNSGNSDGAIREYQAVLALKPADVAESHFELARALNAAHKRTEAKDEVVIALEAAPDFKPAQQLLLQLSQ